MTRQELEFYRYLMSQILELQIQAQAQSVLLDSWNTYGKCDMQANWRKNVKKMSGDAVFRSAVRANLDPYFRSMQLRMKDRSS